MENHHFSWENPRTKWPFSIAMLVHQRVDGIGGYQLPFFLQGAAAPDAAAAEDASGPSVSAGERGMVGTSRGLHHENRGEVDRPSGEHRCPFPTGWLINRGVSLPL